MRDDEAAVRVWLTRESYSYGNVAWIECDGALLALTADGKLLVYEHSTHNTFVVKLLKDNTDGWEEL